MYNKFFKKHNYISLGGGCDAAMVLSQLGFRSKSLPFDWLWNLDEGLMAVTKILQNQYKDVLKENSYILSDHYRFQSEVITYLNVPSIVHLHSDPLNNLYEHEKLVRRFKRLDNILKDNSIKHFIYYRNHEEGKLKDKEITIEGSLSKLLNEANEFCELILNIYPNIKNKFTLLLILQTSPVNESIALEKIKKFQALNKNKSLKLGYTIERNDNEIKYQQIWLKQWKSNLYTKTSTSWLILIQIKLKTILLDMKQKIIKKLADLKKFFRDILLN